MLRPLVSHDELKAEAKVTGIAVERFWINRVSDGVAYFYSWHGEPRSTILVVHEPREREVPFIEVRTFGDMPVEGPHFRQIAESVSSVYSAAGYKTWDGNRTMLLDHIAKKYADLELGLDVKHTTKTACRKLSEKPLPHIHGEKFVSGMFSVLDVIWSRILDTEKLSIGKKNWVLRQVCKKSSNNKRPEERLERALIKACKKLGRENWWNQIPVMSGVMGRRSTIDLVHEKEKTAFEFIELKATDNETPLSAAIQVTIYGLVFLLSRRVKDRKRLGHADRPLLDADYVSLCVLAPTSFYDDYRIGWFEKAINDGLRKLASKQDVKMAFEFQKFPPRFDPRQIEKYTDSELMDFFVNRKRVF